MKSVSFWISQTHIIKESSTTIKTVCGFDILTENYVEADRSECFRLTESIIQLLSNRKALILLADSVGDHAQDKANILGKGLRTWSRMMEETEMKTKK